MLVIACIEHKVSLGHLYTRGQRWWSTIIQKDYSGGWLITITANHSNYLVCDRANTQSVTVRKVVKLQLNYCNALVIKWIYNIVLSEKNADVCLSSLLTDVYALFWRQSPTAGFIRPRLRKFDPFLLKSDVNLFNHLSRARCCGCCSAVLSFVDMRLPRIQCRLCIVWSCFYVKLMQIN